MSILAKASRVVRAESDPHVIHSGRGSRAAIDRLVHAIGWLSIGLGASQLLAAPRYTRTLGVSGKEPLVRAFGAREIASGMLTLSTERKAGMWSRVGGDVLDIGVLTAAMRNSSSRGSVALALALVVGITVMDIVGAQRLTARHSRRPGGVRNFSDRSGFPQGIESARGAAAGDTGPAKPMVEEPRPARVA